MIVSELIKKLESILDAKGDLPCMTDVVHGNSSCGFEFYPEPITIVEEDCGIVRIEGEED